MKVYCKKCKIEITNELKEIVDTSILEFIEKTDYIPKSHYVLGKCSKFQNKIIVNKKDLVDIRYHQDTSRIQGCCGVDGLQGINLVCENNHEIGTEQSDCWMPHLVMLESNLTIINYIKYTIFEIVENFQEDYNYSNNKPSLKRRNVLIKNEIFENNYDLYNIKTLNSNQKSKYGFFDSITIIPIESLESFYFFVKNSSVFNETENFLDLLKLIEVAISEEKHIIHYGLNKTNEFLHPDYGI